MKKILVSSIFLLTLEGCTDDPFPDDINLMCSCIESESTSCSYDNEEVVVDFKKNTMVFGSSIYRNLGTTPTSISARDNSDFVVLNRNTRRLTFERKPLREIYLCDEIKENETKQP